MEVEQKLDGPERLPSAGAGEPLSEGRHRRRRRERPARLHIPLDTVALSIWYLVVMPLALFWWGAKLPTAPQRILCWLAFLFGAGGTLLLIVARKPLYRQRHFLSWKSSNLPDRYWRLFFVSRVFVIGSVLLLLALCWLLQAEPRP